MLGACVVYVGISLILGVFLAVLGYRHRVWSRAQIACRVRRLPLPSASRRPRRAASDP
jgi:hypothetical protein